jgi:hypothetical protein
VSTPPLVRDAIAQPLHPIDAMLIPQPDQQLVFVVFCTSFFFFEDLLNLIIYW